MSIIDDAINQRREIEFFYNGHPRVVQPCAHGTHATTANDVVRGYQVGGSSSSRTPPLWDMFIVTKMQGIVVTDRTFSTKPPGYASDDKHMKVIFAQL